MSDQSHPDPAGLVASAAVAPGLSRRRVLRGAAGAGAVGLAAAAMAGAAVAPALADTTRSAATPAAPDAPARAAEGAMDPGPSEPLVVHLRDARSGEMDVFAGVRHTRVRDPDLAARLARAAR
jgi:hypothetical protein